jgi:hypothetical protein
MSITVSGTDWGNANINDIKKVLESAYNELVTVCVPGTVDPITVYYRAAGPYVHLPRPPGEHRVGLCVQGMFWSQYAYQFAHELTHIISNYELSRPHRQNWIEETICEIASLYAVRQMGKSWITNPPWPNWSGFATCHEGYVTELLQKPERSLPPNQQLPSWLTLNLPALEGDRYNRELTNTNALSNVT